MNMIQMEFRFNYHQEDDSLEFQFQMGHAPVVGLRLPTLPFLDLCNEIVKVWQPFIEKVKQHRTEGIKEDIKTDFDFKKWEKLMEDKNG